MDHVSKSKRLWTSLFFGAFSLIMLGLIYLLPINHLFIDAFGEAIKYHDITDISLSKFRDTDAPELFDQRVVLINTQRTDRAKVAATISYLHRHGAGAIGVDLLFDSVTGSAADTALARALSLPGVILAYAFPEVLTGKSNYASAAIGGEEGVRSHEYFGNSARQAFINLGSDDGFTVRAFEPVHEGDTSFALKLASVVDQSVVDDAAARSCDVEWINFRRPQPGERNYIYPINPQGAIQYSHLLIDDFLQDSASYEARFWKDKIVLLGFMGEDEDALSMNDRYYTPLNMRYYHRSLPDMHGICIHANIVSMLLDRDWVNEMPKWAIYIFCFLIFAVNFLIFDELHHRQKVTVLAVRVIQLIQFVLLLVVCVMLMASQSYKVAFMLPIVSVIMSFEFFELYHYLRRKIYQRKKRKVS